MDTIDQMRLLLKTTADRNEASDLQAIQESSENLLRCLNNVLWAGASLATANTSITENETNVKEVRESTKM